MSLEEHTKKSNDQDNMCAICKKKFGEAKVSMPHVDHCHKTGKIRDLLCSKCNVALGCIDEDPKIASNIIKYIKKWS